MNLHPFIAAAVAVALALPAAGQKPRDAARLAPPPVVPQSITIRRGEAVAIPLGIHGIRGGALEFLIRTPPRFGRLSAIKPTGLNSASVIYTAPAKAGATEDRFAYAVRSEEGVSAPGLVSIAIIEPVVIPARLVAPAELVFLPVFPGGRSVVEMELANRGGGVAEGELSVPEPWSVDGIKLYRLPAGKSVTFNVVFKSEKPGTFNGEMILPGPPRTVVALRAVAEERIVATPPRLELAAQSGSLTRMGVFRLSNRSEEDAKVLLAVGPRLLTDRAVTVPARGEVGVPVFADAAEMSAFDEEVKLTAGEWSATVAVHAAGVGAVLQFVKREGIFGAPVAGQEEEGIATLENLGGQPASVRLTIAPPFELRSQTVTVPAKGRVEIPVRLAQAGAGVHVATLNATADGQTARIEIRAEVAEAPRSAPIAGRPAESASARLADEDTSKDGESTQAEGVWFLPNGLPEIPNALGTHVAGIQPASAVIDWAPDLGTAQELHFEERVLSIAANDELQATWVRCTAAPLPPDGDRLRAEVSGLLPAQLHFIRAVSGNGEAATTRFTVQFATPAKKPFVEIQMRSLALIAGIALLGVLLWRRWKARKGE